MEAVNYIIPQHKNCFQKRHPINHTSVIYGIMKKLSEILRQTTHFGTIFWISGNVFFKSSFCTICQLDFLGPFTGPIDDGGVTIVTYLDKAEASDHGSHYHLVPKLSSFGFRNPLLPSCLICRKGQSIGVVDRHTTN